MTLEPRTAPKMVKENMLTQETSRIREFQLPENYVPDALLCLGYPKPEAVKEPSRYDTERKPLKETVWFETYQD